jgi:hypothetical protein
MNAHKYQFILNGLIAGTLALSMAGPALAAEITPHGSQFQSVTLNRRGGPNIEKPSPPQPGGKGRGPGQTGGVGLGGPGGGGPGGPSLSGGPGNLGVAGIGGRGGGGGLSGLGANGLPRPKPGAGSNPGGNRPSLGQLGIGGGLGPANPGPTGLGPIGRPGAPGAEAGQPGQTGIGSGIGIGRPGAGGIGAGRPGVGGIDSGIGVGGPGGVGPVDGPLVFGDGQFQLPEAPAIADNLEPGAAAQQAIETAAGQAPAAAAQAIEVAGQAYEMLWEDYYSAVDYAAEAYYDTVTAAIDYGAGAFEDYYGAAIEASLAAVDDYYENYDAYLDYMAMYPWDSYAYAYDETSQGYASQEPVNVYYYNYYYGAESMVEATVPVTTTGVAPAPVPPIPAQLPAPSAAAYQAIVVFANDQLGAAVQPVYAGQATQEVLNLLATLPTQVQNPVYTAPNLDAVGYYGLLKGGVAALAVGQCAAGQTCQVSADLPAELSQASLGVLALQTGEPLPATPAEALQLVSVMYPKLTGLPFTQLADVPGLVFMAQTSSVAVQNGQPTVVAKVVVAGVEQVNGRTVVYAAVGLGEGYASLLNPM